MKSWRTTLFGQIGILLGTMSAAYGIWLFYWTLSEKDNLQLWVHFVSDWPKPLCFIMGGLTCILHGTGMIHAADHKIVMQHLTPAQTLAWEQKTPGWVKLIWPLTILCMVVILSWILIAHQQ